jgi:hypothetical protein
VDSPNLAIWPNWVKYCNLNFIVPKTYFWAKFEVFFSKLPKNLFLVWLLENSIFADFANFSVFWRWLVLYCFESKILTLYSFPISMKVFLEFNRIWKKRFEIFRPIHGFSESPRVQAVTLVESCFGPFLFYFYFILSFFLQSLSATVFYPIRPYGQFRWIHFLKTKTYQLPREITFFKCLLQNKFRFT